MKPLSALSYTKNNKKKLITSTIAVVVAVLFLFCLQTYIKSIYESNYQLNVNAYTTHFKIFGIDKDSPIPEHILNELETNQGVEKIVPFIPNMTRYQTPGSLTNCTILGIRSQDIAYVMQKHHMTIAEGRLPLEGKLEVALDTRVAINKKVKLGDKIGNSIDKTDSLNGEYTVVGLLEGKDYVSLMPYNTTSASEQINEMVLLQRAALIFPTINKFNDVDALVSSYPKNEVSSVTLSEMLRSFNSSLSIMKTLDMVCIIAIMVMVISVGSSKYVQFFSRKQEFGVLNALGYTKVEIMQKAFMEVLFVNALGFCLGFGAGVSLSFLINSASFSAIGAIAVYFSSKAFLISLYIPLFTTLFTLVPVYRMISKLDPIVMIEGI